MDIINLPRKEYEELVALSIWYENEPTARAFYPGDRFHENVAEYRASCLDEVLDCNDDEMYLSHWIVDEHAEYPLSVVFNRDGQPDGDGIEYSIRPKD